LTAESLTPAFIPAQRYAPASVAADGLSLQIALLDQRCWLSMCMELHISILFSLRKSTTNTIIFNCLTEARGWRVGCNSLGGCDFSPGLGCRLVTLFENHALSIGSAQETSAAPAKKRTLLPLLTVLFVISYGLMTMLIVEQGQTIESQRSLIRELFRDSTELSAAKMKAQQELRNPPSVQTQTPATQIPSFQNRVAKNPSTQAPTRQAPSSQAGPQQRAENSAATKKPQFRMPSKPEADLIDDVRTLITI
jgi:hypothetical protein